MAFAVLVLTAGVLGAPRTSLAGFTSGATVVIVTGLPGDVESERSYEESLARLLEVLARDEARPARLVVLADAPARVGLPKGLAADVRPNSRDAFLRLAGEMEESRPLVVLAWGHGGLQGARPVFHVRGPRLTADDFGALARAAGGRPARFVLFFRGSGAFARAVAGPNREVLSSEGTTAFTSDPVGMSLLIEVLRNRPDVDLTALAEEVGRATVVWYEEQHLARTEEPTLWRDGSQRLVAAASPTPRPARAPEAPLGAAPSSAWTGVPPVEPERFPGSPAVVLRRTERYTVGTSPALTREVDELIAVLTPEGESRADINVAYFPPDEKVTFLDCEVRHPGGTVERIDPGAIHEGAADAPFPEYRGPARKAFSLPGARPGAVLRVHYRAEWKSFPLPHVFVSVPLAEDIPVVDATVEFQAPAGSPVHYSFAGMAGREPRVDESPYGVSFVWRFADTPALPGEALAPPDPTPTLHVSTFPDWAAFAGWYRRIAALADQVTPALEQKAAELVGGRTSTADKVRVLYEYVTSLRYVAIPLGVNSHRPHAADRVLKNRYGDCKDKANLLNTLLRTQGIQADLVLVPRFSQAFEATPGLGFNHAISRVRLGDAWVFLDSTDPFARFGFLPPGDPGRNVLVIDEEARGLTRLPPPGPEDHRLVLHATVSATDDASIEARAFGFADYALRAAAREAPGNSATRPVLTEMLRPVAGFLGLQSQTHTPTSALDQEFVWSGKGKWVGLTSNLGTERLARAPFFVPREWDQALHLRRLPLHLNQGYPLVLDERVEIVLPPGARVESLPRVQALTEPPLTFHVEWSTERERLRARLRVQVSAGELSPEETRAFQATLPALFAALAQGAVYTPGEGAPQR